MCRDVTADPVLGRRLTTEGEELKRSETNSTLVRIYCFSLLFIRLNIFEVHGQSVAAFHGPFLKKLKSVLQIISTTSFYAITWLIGMLYTMY